MKDVDLDTSSQLGRREHLNYATVPFVMAIAIIGFIANGIGYSVRALPLLPLVAALQLIAGVRLGLIRGLIAATIGALFADIFAHENLTLIHFLSDPLLIGAPINALLPSLLLRLFQIDLYHSEQLGNKINPSFIMPFFIVTIVIVGISPSFIGTGSLIYKIATLLLFIAAIMVLSYTLMERKQIAYLFTTLLICSFMASLICSEWQLQFAGWISVTNKAIPWLFWEVIFCIAGFGLSGMFTMKYERKSTRSTLGISAELIFRVLFIVMILVSSLYLLSGLRHPLDGTRIYDEGLSVYGATRVMGGEIPYRDFWTLYAPGQFYMLALAFKIFGTSIIVDRIVSKVILFGISVLIYFLMRQSVPRVFAALAFLLSIICLADLSSYAYNMPSALMFSFLGFLFSIYFLEKNNRFWLFLSGVMTGIVTLFRDDFGLYILISQFVSVVPFIYLRYKKDSERGTAYSPIGKALKVFFVCFFTGFLLILLPPTIFFLSSVPLHELIYDLLIFPVTILPRARSLPYPRFLPSPMWVINGTISPSTYLHTIVTFLWFSFPLLVYCSSITIFVYRALKKKVRWESSDPWIIIGCMSMGLLFFNYGKRPDPTHISASLLPAMMLFIILIHDLTLQKKITGIKLGFLLLLLFTGFFPFREPALNHIKAMESHADDSPAVFKQGRAMGIEMCAGDTAYQKAIDYIDDHVSPNEYIYVGLGRHDKIYANDVMFYFLADRNNATKFNDFYPGYTTERSVQKEIIDEVSNHSVRYIVLFYDRKWTMYPPEPNESSNSSGCHLLDDFIHANFSSVENFGDYEVLKLKGNS